MRLGTRTDGGQEGNSTGLRILNRHSVGSIETEEGVDGGN